MEKIGAIKQIKVADNEGQSFTDKNGNKFMKLICKNRFTANIHETLFKSLGLVVGTSIKVNQEDPQKADFQGQPYYYFWVGGNKDGIDIITESSESSPSPSSPTPTKTFPSIPFDLLYNEYKDIFKRCYTDVREFSKEDSLVATLFIQICNSCQRSIYDKITRTCTGNCETCTGTCTGTSEDKTSDNLPHTPNNIKVNILRSRITVEAKEIFGEFYKGKLDEIIYAITKKHSSEHMEIDELDLIMIELTNLKKGEQEEVPF